MSVAPDTTSSAAPATQSLIAGLLRGYMELKTEQVVVYNQKWKIPPDDRIYITIASIGPQKPYGATVEQRLSVDGSQLLEDVAIPTREMIGVDIYSRSQDALNRKEEILQALASTQAQQLSEQWALKLARIPMTFVDLSGVEGVAILNRFHLAFAVLRTRTKTSVIEYYNEFQKPALVIEP